MDKGHWNHNFGSAHNFPRFVEVGAAMEHELRKVGTTSVKVPRSGRADIAEEPIDVGAQGHCLLAQLLGRGEHAV